MAIKRGFLRASFLFIAITFNLIALIACDSADNDQPTTLSLSGATMGTTYNISLVSSPTGIDQAQLQTEIDDLLRRLNQQMSTYIDDSDIIKFNQGPIDQWQVVPAEFFEVIALSQQISVLTNGQFDITIGPLVELWGFGKRDNQKVPEQSAIDKAKDQVGWQKLLIDKEASSIKKSSQLWLDVSAVAKGYGVDQIAKLVEQKGVNHYLIEIGGEMRVKGLNSRNTQWRVGIEVPSLLQQQAHKVITLTDKAIATSGDYRNYFEEDGQRFSHTIDPLTGQPVKHAIASVTVISDTAAQADALATALNVLGEDAALAFAKKEGLAAYFIFYDNVSEESPYRTYHTDQFSQFLTNY